MEGQKYQGAILQKDNCLYCPECNSRIKIRFPLSGIVEKFQPVKGVCKCEGPIKYDWDFCYILEHLKRE